MGLQSATITRLGVAGVSTTYITGTWTALGRALGGRIGTTNRRLPPAGDTVRQAVVVAVYAVSALASAALVHAVGGWALLVPACLLVGVIATHRWMRELENVPA